MSIPVNNVLWLAKNGYMSTSHALEHHGMKGGSYNGVHYEFYHPSGSGFFDTIANWGKRFYRIIQPHLSNVVKAATPHVTEAIKDLGQRALTEGVSRISKLVEAPEPPKEGAGIKNRKKIKY